MKHGEKSAYECETLWERACSSILVPAFVAILIGLVLWAISEQAMQNRMISQQFMRDDLLNQFCKEMPC